MGLGHEFLRHVMRTRILVHVVDVSEESGRDPLEDYRTIRRELELYHPDQMCIRDRERQANSREGVQ